VNPLPATAATIANPTIHRPAPGVIALTSGPRAYPEAHPRGVTGL
jgi:hypothetical protein